MRLIDWNIQWGRDASGRVELARTVAQARALADFDVWCVQELTRGFPALPGGPGRTSSPSWPRCCRATR
ncbi:hypothetical protein B7760_01384 [Burkholderia glumae]|nr:hypothetical protein B7760_01384 [Burkholderia glumae]